MSLCQMLPINYYYFMEVTKENARRFLLKPIFDWWEDIKN